LESCTRIFGVGFRGQRPKFSFVFLAEIVIKPGAIVLRELAEEDQVDLAVFITEEDLLE
jgi:hypothetical protein